MCPRSIAGLPFSQVFPGYLIIAPPSVCVPDVIGALAAAVWIQNQNGSQRPRLLTTKLICPNSHSAAAALSAPMMLLCCSFASASFTSKNPLSLSVDRLNSKTHTIFRASLIATPSGRLPQKRFTKKDPGSRLYRVS